jgi:hypothetical protein
MVSSRLDRESSFGIRDRIAHFGCGRRSKVASGSYRIIAEHREFK